VLIDVAIEGDRNVIKKEAEKILKYDQPRGLVVRVSDYSSRGPRFDSWFYYGDFSLKGKIPTVTMVWVD
jgi:hypothetical protein